MSKKNPHDEKKAIHDEASRAPLAEHVKYAAWELSHRRDKRPEIFLGALGGAVAGSFVGLVVGANKANIQEDSADQPAAQVSPTLPEALAERLVNAPQETWTKEQLMDAIRKESEAENLRQQAKQNATDQRREDRIATISSYSIPLALSGAAIGGTGTVASSMTEIVRRRRKEEAKAASKKNRQ